MGSGNCQAGVMATSTVTGIGHIERRHLVAAGFRAIAMSALIIAAYYLTPLDHRAHQSVALRLGAGLALFAATLSYEVRSITRSQHPMLRAGVAMATVIPLFLIVFAWIYLTMSTSNPAAFGQLLHRTSALYFTVSVFSTVGFGDITPHTDVARLVTTVQMLADLVVVAVVIRLILGAATRGMASGEVEDVEEGKPTTSL